jgi:hypothetical protein
MFAVRIGDWPKLRFLYEVIGIPRDRMNALLKTMPMIEIVGESVTIKLEEKKKQPRWKGPVSK